MDINGDGIQRLVCGSLFLVDGYSQWLNDHALTPIEVEIHPLAPGQPDVSTPINGYDYQQPVRQES